MQHSLGMMVVSPGGAVMVTGMWMALLLRPAWLALVEFFWLSASSCFSPRLRVLRIACRGLEASSSASGCLSLRKEVYLITGIIILCSQDPSVFFCQMRSIWESFSVLLGIKPQLVWQQNKVDIYCCPNTVIFLCTGKLMQKQMNTKTLL